MRARNLIIAAALLVSLVCGSTGVACAQEGSVTYQINAAHDGSIRFKRGFTPPLRRIWVRDLDGFVSYPVIAKDMVFVTVRKKNDGRVSALDLKTGATKWERAIPGTLAASNAAYDTDRLFVTNYEGLVFAFDAATGALLWSRQLKGQHNFNSAPVAHRGRVFVTGEGVGGTMYAIDASTGRLRWKVPVPLGRGSPAASGVFLYAIYTCGRYLKLDSRNGDRMWPNRQKLCYGAFGNTPVYHADRIYLQDYAFSDVILDSETGEIVGSHGATQTPAFWTNTAGQSFEISNYHDKLYSTDIDTGNVVWSFSAPRSALSSAPLIINDVVAIGSYKGDLYVLNAATGALIWSENVGAPISRSGEQGYDLQLWTGLGAGLNTLLVPAGNLLSAYVPQ
jgi:outer membrane protein assembly factor BamB